METLLRLSVPLCGLFLGTLLFSRVGAWIQALTAVFQDEHGKSKLAMLLLAVFFHSGPWLAAAASYWAYRVLSAPHGSSWEWFFGAALAALPVWIVVLVVLHQRSKRPVAERAKSTG
jgi:uncharacterized membrane-anchored protein